MTSYNQQGFPEIATLPAGYLTAVKSYNEQGFLITNSPSPTTQALGTAVAESVAAAPSASQKLTKVMSNSAKGPAACKAANFGIVFVGWLLATLAIS